MPDRIKSRLFEKGLQYPQGPPFNSQNLSSKRRDTMFCFQCQETAKNTGCTIKGVCGIPAHPLTLASLRMLC